MLVSLENARNCSCGVSYSGVRIVPAQPSRKEIIPWAPIAERFSTNWRTSAPCPAWRRCSPRMLSQESRAASAGRRPPPACNFSPIATPREHTFHAHAAILRADAQHPLTQELGSQGFVRLPDEGGFRSQFTERYESDGISFKSAYMHVAGTRSSKVGYGWVTLSTSGYNRAKCA